ncbi:MAG: hypothetical protein KA275_02275 [Chitinophagaceae bacterium]|nr:hypothetical protein [Chitinophagaceae bacterium]
MKNLLILFILLFAIKNSAAQSYIKFNPVRSLFSEATVFYEQDLTKNNSLEVRAGLIYRSEIVNVFSSIKSGYGYVDYVNGVSNGFSLGTAYRKYFGKESKFFIHGGINFKTMNIKTDLAFDRSGSAALFKAEAEAKRTTIQPQILIGIRKSYAFVVSPYFGFGASIINGTLLKVKNINIPPSIYSIEYVNNVHPIFNNDIISPTIHLGIQLCFRTSKSKKGRPYYSLR